MHKISENLTVIQNVSSDFFLLFRSNNTNSSNEMNLQRSPSIGQQRSKREASLQNDIPCQNIVQEITLLNDSYEIISHDGDSLVLLRTPKISNIACTHQKQQCCNKTATYCRIFSRKRRFIRISNNKVIVPRSLTDESLGEYCKYTSNK